MVNDMKIDWKRKLSSRKLWMAIAGLVAGLLVYFGKAESEATQVQGLIMMTGSVVAYILSEGWVDSANAGYVQTYSEGEEEDDENVAF